LKEIGYFLDPGIIGITDRAIHIKAQPFNAL
jgi:hypothetical protein